MELSPLLLDAKKEYVIQLSYVLTPYVFQDFQALAAGVSPRQFQDHLRGVPGWNDLTIQAKTTDVEAKHPYLSDLITACFVSWTKVMSSIKIHDNVSVKLSLPRTATFVHTVYVNVAKEMYERPNDIKAIDRVQKLELVREAIDTSIRALLPIHDIVKAYVADPMPPGDMYNGAVNAMPGMNAMMNAMDPLAGFQQAQHAEQFAAPQQPAEQPPAVPTQAAAQPAPQAPGADFNQQLPFDYIQQQLGTDTNENKTVHVPTYGQQQPAAQPQPGMPQPLTVQHDDRPATAAGPELFPDAEGDLF